MVIERPVMSFESEALQSAAAVAREINQSPRPHRASQISIGVEEAQTQTTVGACVGLWTWVP